MTWPLAESHSEELLREPGYQFIGLEYDELFEDSYTLAHQTLEKVFGCSEAAVDFAADALTEIGISWRYVVQSREYVCALAVVLALRHEARSELIARYTALARERQQGRSRSSAHDVHFAAAEWLVGYVREFSVRQREAFDEAVGPLTLDDLAVLFDLNVHQVPRAMAHLWRAGTPEEEP